MKPVLGTGWNGIPPGRVGKRVQIRLIVRRYRNHFQ
jgi:hypothetical protein